MKLTLVDIEKNTGWGFGFDLSSHGEGKTVWLNLNLWKIWINLKFERDAK